MIDDYDESSGWMFLLVPAHPGFPGQIPQSRKTVVCVCVMALCILSGTTRASRFQKGKTNLDFLEQETVSGSGISWAICKSAPRPRQITTPAPHHFWIVNVRSLQSRTFRSFLGYFGPWAWLVCRIQCHEGRRCTLSKWLWGGLVD